MEKRPEIDIYKALRRNNLVVWGMTIAFVLAMLFISLFMYRMHVFNMNHVLTLDKNGDVLPLTWIERDENLKVEMKHHLEMFHEYFYGYDRYNWKTQLEKALWLGDESVEKLFLKRENEGWFDQVTQLAISQKIIIVPDSIKVYGNKEPFEFELPATLIIGYSVENKVYHFRTTGLLIAVSRNYPLNPHGFLITRFREFDKIEIPQQ